MKRGTKALIGALALLLLAPLVVVLSSPLHASAPEWGHVAESILPSYLLETTELLVLTVFYALAFGISAAWIAASFNFPGRSFFRWALVLPLALPTYISAITFAALLGPTGSITDAVADATGVRMDIMSLQGLALVLALVLFPYVYLPARAAFSAGMSAQLDAARMLGGGALRRFFRVAMPLARPAIAGGALLVSMETLNDYGAVKYYGVRTLTAGIFRSWGGLYDVGSALRLSGILLLLVIALVTIERSLKRRAAHTTANHDVQRVTLHGWRAGMALGWCGLLFFASFVLPVFALVKDARDTWIAGSMAEFGGALVNTLTVGTMAAAVTLTIALLFVFAQRSDARRLRTAQWASIGYVVPGAVIAIGVMALAGALTRWTGVLLIGTIALMVYAFAVRFLALATQPLQAGLKQQPRAMDEAARLLGASPARTFMRINLPLLRPAVIGAALLVMMEVVKELPLTMILRPFNFDTLSTRVYELARIEQWREAALPALLIVLCGLVPVLVLDRLLERRPR